MNSSNIDHYREPKSKFGFVIFLDILGTSEHDKNKLINILKFFQEVRLTAKDRLAYEYRNSKLISTSLIGLKDIDVIQFQDSLLVTVEIENSKSEVLYAFGCIAAFSSWMITYGIENKILIRGGIELGDYITDGYSALGAAVVDAIKCEGKFDWCGVTLAPRAKTRFASLCKWANKHKEMEVDEKEYILYSQFVKHLTPYKTKDSQNGNSPVIKSSYQYVVSWPLRKIARKEKGISTEDYLANMKMMFDEQLISNEAVRKFNHTYDYFKWLENEIVPELVPNWPEWYSVLDMPDRTNRPQS